MPHQTRTIVRRGPKRLATVTYQTVADWTGLSVQTVRSYANRGHLETDSLEHILSWTNRYRRRLGFPPIGHPDLDSDSLDT